MDLKLDIQKFEEFISQYPVYEYRILDTKELKTEERVRIICRQECERYGTTWACPPAVGTLEECRERLNRYDTMLLFTSFQRQAIRLTVPPSPDYRV